MIPVAAAALGWPPNDVLAIVPKPDEFSDRFPPIPLDCWPKRLGAGAAEALPNDELNNGLAAAGCCPNRVLGWAEVKPKVGAAVAPKFSVVEAAGLAPNEGCVAVEPNRPVPVPST